LTGSEPRCYISWRKNAHSRKNRSHLFTATILEWKRLLKHDKYKDIIVDSPRFLVEDERIYLYGFVIMDNHIHCIWQLLNGYNQQLIQHSLLKFTAQKMKYDLVANHPDVLEGFRVDAKDREYQFWERNPLSVNLWNEVVLLQKLKYVHQNPVRAGLCLEAADYYYSSAAFNERGDNVFDFLTRYERY
jgi:REP element-mobilizing transposase RayT